MSEPLKLPKAEYCRKFNRSRITINKWILQGAPLDDDVKMVDWIEQRNEMIGGTKPFATQTELDEALSSTPAVSPLGQPAPKAQAAVHSKSEVALKAERAGVDLEIAKHKLSVLRNEVIDRSKIREAGISIGSILDVELTAVEQEIPGVCAGLSEIELKTRLPSFFIRIRKNLKEQLEKHVDATSQPTN